MRKLPVRYHWLVLPLVMSVFMTCIVSAVSIARVRGVSSGFFDVWLPAWVVSWTVAFPVLLAINPLVRRVVSLLVEAPSRQ
jgi:Protein of unknown function (DUF2798)